MTPVDHQRLERLTSMIYTATPPGYTHAQALELALAIMKALNL